jgi:omega-amidase
MPWRDPCRIVTSAAGPPPSGGSDRRCEEGASSIVTDRTAPAGPTQLRLAVVQMAVIDGQPRANLERARTLLAGIPSPGFVLLPELWTTGYDVGAWRKTAESETPLIVEELRGLAADLDAFIGGSMVAATETGELRNRFYVVPPDWGAPVTYDKVHLFAPLDEPKHFGPGERRVRMQFGAWAVTPSICFDLRFPEFFRRADRSAAELILVAAEWPAVRASALRVLVRARAIENQSYLALANRVGPAADGLVFGGESCIVGPDGTVLEGVERGEGYALAVLERDTIMRARTLLPETGRAPTYADDCSPSPSGAERPG